MKVESMVAQQAILATAARTAARGPRQDRQPAPAPDATAKQLAGSQLPTAIADRLADLFASDPGLAAAVTAQLPAARQASARDLAAYGRAGQLPQRPRLIDVPG